MDNYTATITQINLGNNLAPNYFISLSHDDKIDMRFPIILSNICELSATEFDIYTLFRIFLNNIIRGQDCEICFRHNHTIIKIEKLHSNVMFYIDNLFHTHHVYNYNKIMYNLFVKLKTLIESNPNSKLYRHKIRPTYKIC